VLRGEIRRRGLSVSADYLLDRRRLSRQVTFWRAAAFVVAALAILGLGLRYARLGGGGDEIAKLRITGLITGDDQTIAALRAIGNSHARALILAIDSPGGTTAGAERLYDEIRLVAAKKPTVAVVGALGASGAYIAALAADRIYVRQTSLIGSIGVLAEYPNFSGLLDKLGVKYETIKSSPLKAVPNGLQPTSDAARHRRRHRRQLRLVQRPGARAPRHERRPTRCGRRWPHLHRPAEPAFETGRRARGRARGRRLVERRQGRAEEPAGARLYAERGLCRFPAAQFGERRGRGAVGRDFGAQPLG
jgi:hypothetical protein